MSRRSEILVDLGAKHGLATTQYLKELKDRLDNGTIAMNGPEIKADGLTELRKLTGLVYSSVDSSDANV